MYLIQLCLVPRSDPWNMEPVNEMFQAQATGGSVESENSANRRQLKTPESFLGENSSLVNLDNLMGPVKPAGPTKCKVKH